MTSCIRLLKSIVCLVCMMISLFSFSVAPSLALGKDLTTQVSDQLYSDVSIITEDENTSDSPVESEEMGDYSRKVVSSELDEARQARFTTGDVIVNDYGGAYKILSLDTSTCPWENSSQSCHCSNFRGSVVPIEPYNPNSQETDQYLTKVLLPYKIDLAKLRTSEDWKNLIDNPRLELAMNVEFFDSEYDAQNSPDNGKAYMSHYDFKQVQDIHWDNISFGGIAEASPTEYYVDHYVYLYQGNEKKRIASREIPGRSQPCKVRKGDRLCEPSWVTTMGQIPINKGEAIAFSHVIYEKDNGRPNNLDKYDQAFGNFMDTMLDFGSIYIDESQTFAIQTVAWAIADLVTGNGVDDRFNAVNTKYTYGALRRLHEYQQESHPDPINMLRFSSRAHSSPIMINWTGTDSNPCRSSSTWAMNAPFDVFKYYGYLNVSLAVDAISNGQDDKYVSSPYGEILFPSEEKIPYGEASRYCEARDARLARVDKMSYFITSSYQDDSDKPVGHGWPTDAPYWVAGYPPYCYMYIDCILDITDGSPTNTLDFDTNLPAYAACAYQP